MLANFHLYNINIFFSDYYQETTDPVLLTVRFKIMCVRQTTGTLSRCKQSLNKDDKFRSALLDWVCKEIRKRCATCVEKKKTVLH